MSSFFSKKAFTLIEMLLGISIFLIIALATYQTYVQAFQTARISRLKTIAGNILNEQIEIIRNLPYSDVGIIGGIPSGKINQNQTIVRNEINFDINTVIRNIDDPFDGLIGEDPNDLSPADYKLIEVKITCPSVNSFGTVYFNTTVAPKALETASTNGALFVEAMDSFGQHISGADIHIENNFENPSIIINETTDNNGLLQLIDVIPGVEAYEITISKLGYSIGQTYPSGDAGNPNPIKLHANVALQTKTSVSFLIDKLSTLNIYTTTDTCAPVSDKGFDMHGAKLIGAEPNVLKYNATHTTDENGAKILNDFESDMYTIIFNDVNHDLAGSIPLNPLFLNPDSVQDWLLIVAPKNPLSLMVTVKDASVQLPLSGAAVKIEIAGIFEETLITGRGFMRQTDWSLGSGQTNFVDSQKYFSDDGNVEIIDPAGEARLLKILENYANQGELISSTFDTGSPSNFYNISWMPMGQPPEAGDDSVRFQLASNNDQTTWNFLGHDGTADTYYTLADNNINSIHNGDRYFRYKLFLQTINSGYTPNIAEVAVTFTSNCIPPGQVLFTGLTAGTYALTVSKSGYETSTFSELVISNNWDSVDMSLMLEP